MRLADRQRHLDGLLPAFRDLWHPQPFREIRPAWCARHPDLARELLDLTDAEAARLNDDSAAALGWLARYRPGVDELVPLAAVAARYVSPLRSHGPHWAWEIPGRKQRQIEAFASASACAGHPILDWCGGKGHLGRLLALEWEQPVRTLEIDPALCAAGEGLARRAGVRQDFAVADALTAAAQPHAGEHAVALHACGELHRRLVREGASWGLARIDVVPCCYYRGATDDYVPLSGETTLALTRDDLRLAVTETVTSAPREGRQRDRGIAWKLGFDAYRRASGEPDYRSFKPVPESWLRGSFADFLAAMAAREGLPVPGPAPAAEFEQAGWRRHAEVMRLSVVRHAFRRTLEVWLVLDLACFLEHRGYAVELGTFCERQLTPRNLLLSALRA